MSPSADDRVDTGSPWSSQGLAGHSLAATGAFANDEFNGEAFYQKPQASASSLTRAQVKADLAQALAAGQIVHGDLGYKIPDAVSTKSRAQVKAELTQARAAGELITGDAIYKFPHAASTKTRAEVRDEVIKAGAEDKLLRSEG